MDIRPTTRTGTVTIHTVTIRRIIGQLSIIAPRLGLITGGTASAYLFGIIISGGNDWLESRTWFDPMSREIRFSRRLMKPQIKAGVYHRYRHR